jgi:hypothetical protein
MTGKPSELERITLGDFAEQIGAGKVDIVDIHSMERHRADVEQRREIAQSYKRKKAPAALLQMADDHAIRPRSSASECASVSGGNLERPEAWLVTQAQTLDALFQHLTRMAYYNMAATFGV